MANRVCLLLIAGLGWSAARPAEAQSVPDPSIANALAAVRPERAHRCTAANPAEVIVCGRSRQQFRIDPDVLAATRAAEAPPAKPELDATAAPGCTGPNCGGGTIPLVGMALTAIKAAELAAQGDDWRDAFRTHPDSYSVYQEEKAKRSSRPSVSFGIVAGSK